MHTSPISYTEISTLATCLLTQTTTYCSQTSHFPFRVHSRHLMMPHWRFHTWRRNSYKGPSWLPAISTRWPSWSTNGFADDDHMRQPGARSCCTSRNTTRYPRQAASKLIFRQPSSAYFCRHSPTTLVNVSNI